MNEAFQKFILQKGRELYRAMPWRDDTRPYYVLVSELMLQQTQVSRVIPKFDAFILRFPDEKSLAEATLGDVLRAWQGLGYNRRAKYLHEAARKVVKLGAFPNDEAGLLDLPGVGKNTAGAILAYSFNRPAIFVETNIRTVYIHHFFSDDFFVDDKLIRQKLEETLDATQPQVFYQALMDYGSWLKAGGIKNLLRSKHYKKQPPLKGSLRETRGQIIRALAERDMTADGLKTVAGSDERFGPALDGLLRENLVEKTGRTFHLTK